MKKGLNIALTIILIIFCYLLAISMFVKFKFPTVTFEQLWVSLWDSEGASIESIKGGALYTAIIGTIILLVLVILPIIINKISKNDNYLIKNIFLLLEIIIVIVIALYNVKVFEYIKYQSRTSKIYEKYYVDPNDVDITFPDKKYNLIYIYMESMEMSYNSMVSNNKTVSYIPNLATIAEENTNFSNTNKLGGALSAHNTTWTVASLVAQTSGVNSEAKTYANGIYLPGVKSIGEILEDNGYKNYLMIGSNADFAGRRNYFTNHGNYNIFDLTTARNKNYIDKDYKVWWGYEDKKLYEYAKEELTEISQNDEPFNFTMLTADTHFPNGYVDESCKTDYNTHYANSIACSDQMVSEFISWIQEQDFANDTVIIITGDHLTMDYSKFNNEFDDNIERTVYNAFINSQANTSDTFNRKFTVLDMYPTTLAALGAEIDGNKLGLGVNLYSDEQTLTEKLGLTELNIELAEKSNYYKNNFLK